MRAAGGFEVIQSFHDALDNASRRKPAIIRLQDWLNTLGVGNVDRLTLQRSMIWLTLLGAVDAAHDLGARTVDSLMSSAIPGCGWGILWIDEMRAFRASERFHALTLRLGLHEYWRQYGPPDGDAIQA
jgi:hypothetical protein